MNKNEQGLVFPFRLSGQKLRRSAETYRRHGMMLDALTLTRRAAEQEDTVRGWLSLARELRSLGAVEAASRVVGDILSREDRETAAWGEMARCQMSARPALAVDCLYHQLQEAPWAPENENARMLLSILEYAQQPHGPRRVPLLLRRAEEAWLHGDASLGKRRFLRAIRIAENKAEGMIALAEMYLRSGDAASSLCWLFRALKLEPKNSRALCGVSRVCWHLDKDRAARAWLARALPLQAGTEDEMRFFRLCWDMEAWDVLGRALGPMLKETPYRPFLCDLQGAWLYIRGEIDAADDMWRRALAVDPSDRAASAYLTFLPAQMMPIFPPWDIPMAIRRAQQVQFVQMLEENLLTPGSPARSMLDWFAFSPLEEEQKLALGALLRHEDGAAVDKCFRALLTTPGASPLVCGQALICLGEHAPEARVTFLMDGHYIEAPCRLPELPGPRKQWRIFLTALLKETRRYRQSGEIAEFAAGLWRAMTVRQRLAAASTEKYLWCKAFEVLFLRMHGQEEKAALLVTQLLLSPRRLSRVLRQLGHVLQYDPALPEKEEP